MTRTILSSLDQLPPATRLAIYGSGKIGMGFKAYVERHRRDLVIACFVNTFSGGMAGDTPIVPLTELTRHASDFDTIVVCSSLWDQIEDELLRRPWSFCVISNALMYETLEVSRLGSFRFDPAEQDAARERLARVAEWFEAEDQYHFDLLAKLHLSDDEGEIFTFLKSAAEKFRTPYLDYIDNTLTGDVILEGGVADGSDTMNFYRAITNERLKVYGFEPLPDVFDRGQHKAALLARGMEIHSWALWDANQDLRFRQDGATATTSAVVAVAGHRAPDDQETVVRGVTLDSFVAARAIGRIGLIKLDIEGAEREALAGARRIISEDKPQLAIAIYHKKEHLFELPELLRAFHPGYRFRLRLPPNVYRHRVVRLTMIPRPVRLTL